MITPEQLAKSGSEDAHQAALFCWAALNIKQYPKLKWLFAIPNGGSRDIREATKLKATGVKRGVPDICLPVKRGQWSGLWIELKKNKKAVTSDEQKEYIAFLKSQGYGAMVCYGWEEARNMLIKYLEIK